MGRRRTRAAVSVSLFSFQDIITCLSGIMILLVLLISLDIVIRKLPDNNTHLQAKQRPPDHTSLSPSDALYVSEVSKSPLKPVSTTLPVIFQTIEQELRMMMEQLKTGKRPDPVKVVRMVVEMDSAESTIIGEKEKLKREINKLEQHHAEAGQRETDLRTEEMALNSKLATLKDRYDDLVRDKSLTLIPQKGGGQKPLLVECSGDLIRWGRINSQGEPAAFSPRGKGLQQFMASLGKVSKTHEYLLFMIKPSASGYAMQLIGQVRHMGFDVGYDAMVEENSLSFGRPGSGPVRMP